VESVKATAVLECLKHQGNSLNRALIVARNCTEC
jgi:hypothetical protein